MTMTAKSHHYYSSLRDELDGRFDMGEIRTLCFDLGVDFDNLAGETKIAKAQSLIIYLNKRGRTDELIYRLLELRPDADWTAIQPTDFLQPYRGLSAFREEDSPFFFGRDNFVKQLVTAVRQQSLVAVIGSSGSGKSSVVFAGLIPELRQEPDWLIVDFRPGSQPFNVLRDTLLPLLNATDGQPDLATAFIQRLKSGDLTLSDVLQGLMGNDSGIHHLLLIIDQFEELYTLGSDAETRQRFTDVLLQTSELDGLTILLAMRADFMGQAATHRSFADALQNATYILGPMNDGELAEVVEEPAQVAGSTFEAGLVTRVLDDLNKEPGHLPILEFALTLLWDQQEKWALTHAAYEAIGEINGTLASYAENAFVELSESERQQARHIFLQLVQPGAGTEDTRRQATISEVGEENWELVQWLADKRLVVTNKHPDKEETVEIVHEALIQEWGRLRGWMDTDRRFREWQERLRVALSQWQEAGEDESALLRGTVLAEAQGWLVDRAREIPPREQSFIEDSVAAQERIRARKLRRRNIALAVSLLAALLFGLLGLFSFNQSQDLAFESTRAKAGELAAVASEQTAVALAKTAEEAREEADENLRKVESSATLEAIAIQTAESLRVETDNAEATAAAERDRANREAEAALARQLTTQDDLIRSENIEEVQLSILLAVEAMKRFDTLGERSLSADLALREAISFVPQNLGAYFCDDPAIASNPNPGYTAAFSVDGKFLTETCQYSGTTRWDLEGNQEVASIRARL